MLLYTTVPDSKGFCKAKQMLPLIEMSLEDIADGTLKAMNFAFHIKTSVKSFTVHATSVEEKQEWMEFLSAQIDMLKRNASTIKLAQVASPTASSTPTSASTPHVDASP